jgi:hypothetical protein
MKVVIDFVAGLRGYRKMVVMLAILVTLAGLLVADKILSSEFIDALKFISTAFFAANFGGKLAGKTEVSK